MSKKEIRQLGQSTSELTLLNEKVIPYLKTLGYRHVDFDMQINSNGRIIEADAVVFVDAEKKQPYIVIEVKHFLRNEVTLLDPAVQHAFSIATVLGKTARYLLITDGTKYEWFERTAEGQSLSPLRYPPYSPQESIQSDELASLLPILDPEKYSNLIQKVIDVLRQEGLAFGLRMGLELNRILLAKLYDERMAAQYGEHRFLTKGEDPYLVASRVKHLYMQVMDSLGGAFINEDWVISPKALFTVVRILEPYSLTSVSQSVLERSFWREFQNLLTKDERQYTTPVTLAEFLVEIARPTKKERIIDPACGSGLFLLEAFDYISSRINSEPDVREAPDHIKREIGRNVTGIELNPTVAELAATNFALNGLSPHQVSKANSLRTDELERARVFSENYDVVLMNPPFGAAPNDESILREYEVSQLGGKIRLEVFFLERAIRLLRPGGRMAVLVPDSLLSSPALKSARKWLLYYMIPKAIISLPPESFAPVGHSGKASVLLLERKRNEASNEEGLDVLVFLADVRAVGYDRFGLPTRENDLPQVIEMFHQFQEGQVHNPFEQEHLKTWKIPLSKLDATRLDIGQLAPERDSALQALSHSQYSTVKIKQIADVISGRNFKSYIEESDQGITVIQAGAVRELELAMSSCPFISFKEYDVAKRVQVQIGDVLVTTTGHYLGRAAVVEELLKPAVISSAVTILRPSSEIDPLFLAAILNSVIGREQVSRFQASATAQPYIRRSDLGQILIPLPPLEKQRALAYRIRELLAEARELKQRAQALEANSRVLVVTELLGVNDNE